MPLKTSPPGRTLAITLNAQDLATSAATLEDLVAEQGHAGAKIATAVNGNFVPARMRATTKLQAGDRVEILSARQGG
jgi:sulfur carrier protein